MTIKLTIRNKIFQNSIPVKKLTKFLNGFSSLYVDLAINRISEHKRNKSDFELLFNKIHFTEAVIELTPKGVFQSVVPQKDLYLQPIEDMITTLKLAKETNTEESYKQLKELVPVRELRKRIIEDTQKLCPVDTEDSLDIEYSSKRTEPLIYKNIDRDYRLNLEVWNRFLQKEFEAETIIYGLVSGINTNTENPYISISAIIDDEEKVINCFYIEKSFSSDLKISDLRVTKDIIVLKGIYRVMSGKAISRLEDISFIIKLYKDDLDLPKEALKLIYEEYNKHTKMHKLEIDEILDLKDGWDLPDSKGYEEETIILGLLYLSKLSLILWQKFNKKLPQPFILPGGLGEIELEWSDKIELQISIPTDPNKLLGIYGYRGKDEELLIDCKLFEVDEKLLNWLNQLL